MAGAAHLPRRHGRHRRRRAPVAERSPPPRGSRDGCASRRQGGRVSPRRRGRGLAVRGRRPALSEPRGGDRGLRSRLRHLVLGRQPVAADRARCGHGRGGGGVRARAGGRRRDVVGARGFLPSPGRGLRPAGGSLCPRRPRRDLPALAVALALARGALRGRPPRWPSSRGPFSPGALSSRRRPPWDSPGPACRLSPSSSLRLEACSPSPRSPSSRASAACAPWPACRDTSRRRSEAGSWPRRFCSRSWATSRRAAPGARSSSPLPGPRSSTSCPRASPASVCWASSSWPPPSPFRRWGLSRTTSDGIDSTARRPIGSPRPCSGIRRAVPWRSPCRSASCASPPPRVVTGAGW